MRKLFQDKDKEDGLKSFMKLFNPSSLSSSLLNGYQSATVLST